MTEERLKRLEEMSKKVVLPWIATGNIPFYVDVRKPRPSDSKHDDKVSTYWKMEDGEYMLLCTNWMPEILEYIRKLEKEKAA